MECMYYPFHISGALLMFLEGVGPRRAGFQWLQPAGFPFLVLALYCRLFICKGERQHIIHKLGRKPKNRMGTKRPVPSQVDPLQYSQKHLWLRAT